MKKNSSISIRTMAITLALFMAVTAGVFAANPIPGIRIIVNKNPSGIAVSTTNTDDKGKATSSKLTKGTYALEFSKAQATANTPLYPFMLKLEGAAQIKVNNEVWDVNKAIKVEKGTTIQIIIKATDTAITATTTVWD